MKRHTTDNTQRCGPAPDQASGAAIFLHGRGSSGHDGIAIADAISAHHIAFLSPTATNNTWYPHRFFVPLELNEPWLSSALDVIGQQIQSFLDAGVPRQRIALIGFSQGACLALEYFARNPAPLGFVAALSGGLIGPLETDRSGPSFEGTPVLIGCAESDAHIPIEYVKRSSEAFERRGANVTKIIYPGSAHNVFTEELTWITEHFAAWKSPDSARANPT